MNVLEGVYFQEASEWPKVHFYIWLKPKAEYLKILVDAHKVEVLQSSFIKEPATVLGQTQMGHTFSVSWNKLLAI